MDKIRQSDQYETPQYIYDRLNEEFRFKLDVCASDKNHKHENYYTEKDDGLKKDWSRCNWCNPPYSNQIPWIEKAIEAALLGNTTVMLPKLDTSTRAFKYIYWQAKEVRLINHRLSFELNGKPVGPAAFPSAIVVFSPGYTSEPAKVTLIEMRK